MYPYFFPPFPPKKKSSMVPSPTLRPTTTTLCLQHPQQSFYLFALSPLFTGSKVPLEPNTLLYFSFYDITQIQNISHIKFPWNTKYSILYYLYFTCTSSFLTISYSWKDEGGDGRYACLVPHSTTLFFIHIFLFIAYTHSLHVSYYRIETVDIY